MAMTSSSKVQSGVALSYKVAGDTLTLSGDLTSSQVEELVPSFTEDVTQIDLCGIGTFDSAGLAWLVTYFAHPQRKFINYPADLSQLADLYGLSTLFPEPNAALERRDC